MCESDPNPNPNSITLTLTKAWHDGVCESELRKPGAGERRTSGRAPKKDYRMMADEEADNAAPPSPSPGPDPSPNPYPDPNPGPDPNPNPYQADAAAASIGRGSELQHESER